MVLQVTARLELFELEQQQSLALQLSRFCVKTKFLSEEATHGLISLLLFCKIKTVSKRNELYTVSAIDNYKSLKTSAVYIIWNRKAGL